MTKKNSVVSMRQERTHAQRDIRHPLLDPYPVPKDQSPLYINQPWLLDETLYDSPLTKDPEPYPDNIRVYLPMDLNRESILRRLDSVISKYREASFRNEMNFRMDVVQLISQIEIYDRVWFVRKFNPDEKHSAEGKDLVKEFVRKLQEIPVLDSETFPYQTIEDLESEYFPVSD